MISRVWVYYLGHDAVPKVFDTVSFAVARDNHDAVMEQLVAEHYLGVQW